MKKCNDYIDLVPLFDMDYILGKGAPLGLVVISDIINFIIYDVMHMLLSDLQCWSL